MKERRESHPLPRHRGKIVDKSIRLFLVLLFIGPVLFGFAIGGIMWLWAFLTGGYMGAGGTTLPQLFRKRGRGSRMAAPPPPLP